ncbi:MAG: folate-binding protein YgfZ [Proteobacteria bacterium]|nr:folate-binding protein YgfZ [Pseudomonadota bacterium]
MATKQNWIDFLQQQGARNEGLDFGNLPEELLNAKSATILAPLTDIGLIRVGGEDAAVFLHNLLTNDVNGLSTDGVQRNGFCNPKGRLLASFVIWREGTDIMIALSADLHAAILKKLSMYVLRSKVKLSDASDERMLIGLSGPEASKALTDLGPIPTESLKATSIDHGQVMRLDEHRYMLALDASTAESVWRKLAVGARPTVLAAWHWLEIQAGIPIISAATQEEFIPQMINFELIGGVSFKKGCYPGQEIVARTQYLGKIKRRMYRAHLDTALPSAGAHLYAPETGDQSCGRVVQTSPAPQGGNELLAVIQSTCAEAGEVHLDNPSGPRLIFQPLPYALDVTTAS